MKLNVIKIIVIAGLLYLLFSCEQEKNIITLSPNPVIESVTLPGKWNTRTDLVYKVEAKVLDAQGFANIDTVHLEVIDPVSTALLFSAYLHDDGAFIHTLDGDVIAGDGVYSERFTATQIVPAQTMAEYTFRFTAMDKQGNYGLIKECPVQFAPNYPPLINMITAADTFSATPTGQIIRITVSDNDGLTDITRAYFKSQARQGFARIYESDLYNDGDYELHGDTVAGDSVFSVRLDSTFMVNKMGTYLLWFYALDSFSEQNEVVPAHEMFVGNTAPQFVNISLPASVERPVAAGTYKLAFVTAQVYDAQGLADIDSVYFYYRRPDSTLANNGRPFLMVDNGKPFDFNYPLEYAGDLHANDGTYSLSVIVDNATAPGIWTATFYVQDKAGNMSAVQSRTIDIIAGDN
jgi:hypothetical protein